MFDHLFFAMCILKFIMHVYIDQFYVFSKTPKCWVIVFHCAVKVAIAASSIKLVSVSQANDHIGGFHQILH